MANAVTIGRAAELSGIKVPTIRYYEEIGLIGSPARTQSNRRLYDQADLSRLAFIRHARQLGFGVDAIRALIDLQDQPDRPCAEADGLAQARLAEVEARIASLEALRAELKRMIEGCRHGRIDQCRVIEVLADHAQCRHHGAEPTSERAIA